MRTGWRRSALAGAGALTCVVALGAASQAATSTTATESASSSETASESTDGGTAADLAEAQTSSEGVEVRTLGTVTVRPYQSAENPPAVLAVHGVQRVDGATVVYWSAGYADGGDVDVDGFSELSSPGGGNGGYTNGGYLGTVRLVDPAGGQVYRTVANPASSGVASPFASPTSAFPDEAGTMGVLYSVLPELPDSVETVDVDLVFGVTIPDVPVADGLLEPAVGGGDVVPLGTGWPEVDEDALGDIEDPDSYVHEISVVSEALDNSQVVTETGETVTIDLAADVLFAFDKADLNPAAQTKLAEIVQKLIADGATGQISVVGHTDSQGSDSYNLDLSNRRAQSVAAVLQPQLASQGLTFAVEGRGEAEPVADNSTPEGQQANRRVTITYTAGG